VQSIKPVVEKMKAAGVPVDLFMYEHCGHAFMNALTAGGREKIKGTPLCCLSPPHNVACVVQLWGAFFDTLLLVLVKEYHTWSSNHQKTVP
jgi:acetyl esterase/lipase